MRRLVRLAAGCALAAAAAGCGIEKQSAPALTGPSEFATSITLRATPDAIVQDGQSVAAITATVRGPNGEPMPGVTLQFSGTSSDQLIRSVSFTETSKATDVNGQATTGLIAPSPPATVPAQDPVISVRVVPVGGDFANAVERVVHVRLLAPPGTPLANLNPVAVITANPAVANFNETIKFDASLSTDEGQACGSRCTYIWEFGDGTIAVRGISVEHTYPVPDTYIVTLTVTDDRGGVDTASVDIRIIGPNPPVASFTVTPASPTAGVAATFNAGSSTVGSGATITQYAWNFGDGTPAVVTGSPSVTKSFAASGNYTVVLTITDSLGRTDTQTASVTVVP